MSLHQDPHWPRASSWLTGEHSPEPLGVLNVLGVPINRSITPGSCNLAPDAIRTALQRLSCYDIELGVDVRQIQVVDHGDLPISPDDSEAFIEERLSEKLAHSSEPWILLGGDNGLTCPGVLGIDPTLKNIHLLTLDAHLDMRTVENGAHNGNPIRRLIERGLKGAKIGQIGIASFANSAEYCDYATQHGVEFRTIEECHYTSFVQVLSEELSRIDEDSALYVDLDLDVLDLAYAPGCPGARPGGLRPHDLIYACRVLGSTPSVRALDLVELDPTRDTNQATALVAAQCIVAFAAGYATRLGA